MPALLAIVILGIIQGVTEFLPVSSSGHLSLFQYFSAQINEDLSLNVAVHIGTLLTILVYYRRDLVKLLSGAWIGEPSSRTMFVAIIIASIPTALIGLGLKKAAPGLLTNPLVAGVCLLITALILMLPERLKVGEASDLAGFNLSGQQALLVGLVQGFAVLPGISRSGSTIVAGLVCGLSPSNASRFSFLMSVPAVAGAGLLEFLSIDGIPNWTAMGLGAMVSFFIGLAAIHWMVRLTRKGKLKIFSYYLFPVALIFLGLYSLRIGENAF